MGARPRGGTDDAAMNEQTKTENERVGAECVVEQDGIKFVLEKKTVYTSIYLKDLVHKCKENKIN